MRIDDSFAASSDLRSLEVERSQPVPAPERQGGGSRSDQAGDSVAFSSLTSEIARALDEDSPQEIAQVEQAQQTFLSGNLDESPESTAESLIDAALEDTQIEQRLTADAATAV